MIEMFFKQPIQAAIRKGEVLNGASRKEGRDGNEDLVR
jgi:hypothetical protein